MSGSREETSPTDSDSQLPTSRETDQSVDRYGLRLFVAQFLGLVGIVLYNWWLWVIVATNLLVSTDELFSDLETSGHRDATLFQYFDLTAGIIMLVAFLIRGPWGPKGKRKEWRWLLLFALAGTVGGRFSYACPEGLSGACRDAEWHLQLPLHHYVHVVAGIIEFAAMTTAALFAWKRTRDDTGWVSRSYKGVIVTMLIGYPVLGVAYLSDRFGAFVEPIFFLCFSVMVAIELLEPRRRATKAEELLVS